MEVDACVAWMTARREEKRGGEGHGGSTQRHDGVTLTGMQGTRLAAAAGPALQMTLCGTTADWT